MSDPFVFSGRCEDGFFFMDDNGFFLVEDEKQEQMKTDFFF